MNHHFVLKSLDISLIDFNDYSYSVSPDREINPEGSLSESIADHGIIHPPAVKNTISGAYVIISGRRRLQAFHSLFPEKRSCDCLVFSESVSEFNVFSFILEEIIIRRPLTPIERAVFLQKTSSFMDEKRITETFLPRMGLPRDPAQIKKNLKLLDLDDPLIQALHRGDLHEAVVQDLLTLSSNDRLAVYDVISTLQLGVNYQRKLITIVRELAAREKETIGSLLGGREVLEILNHRDANPPQKTKNLMNLLMRQYKPRSSKAEDEFNRLAASLQLPKNISITHTPSFEDDSLTLSITVSDKKTLLDILSKIKDAT